MPWKKEGWIDGVTKAVAARFLNIEEGLEELFTKVAEMVKLTTNQTIAGIKTFSSSPKVPEPSEAAHAATKGYVDAATVGTRPSVIEDTFTAGEIIAGNLVGFTNRLASGEEKKLIGFDARLEVGTSVKVEVRRNGVVIAQLTTVIEKSKGNQHVILAEPQTLADGDYIDVVLSVLTGTPEKLSMTMLRERKGSVSPSPTTTYSGFTAANMPPATWTPYAGSSLWNKLIGTPSLIAEPLQKEIIEWVLKKHAAPQPRNFLAYQSYPPEDFGKPLYWAALTDEEYEIETTFGKTFNGVKIKMPANALPASASDHHLTVVQPNGDQWDFYNAEIVGKKIKAENTSKTSIAGVGNGTATAANFAAIAGNIRPEELIAGVINHALFITVQACSTTLAFPGSKEPPNEPSTESTIVPPATHGAARAADEAGKKPPPCGARLFLEMTDAEIAALGLPSYLKAIATAMAHYGGFIGDTSGGGFGFGILGARSYNAFGLENPLYGYGAAQSLTKVVEGGINAYVYKPSEVIPWATKLRVLQAPSLSETL